MAEGGRKERGKEGKTFFIYKRKNDSSITWESQMLPAIHQVDFFSPHWVLINTEGVPFRAISSEGSHRSHPEKSIMVFTNQNHLRVIFGLHTYGALWAPSYGVSQRALAIWISTYCPVVCQTSPQTLAYRTEQMFVLWFSYLVHDAYCVFSFDWPVCWPFHNVFTDKHYGRAI